MSGTGWTFANYFASAVDAICKVLWREGYARGPQELVRLTGNRIRRLEARFDTLVARWRAGTLPAAGHTSPRPSPQGGEGDAKARARAVWPFPRARGWVVRLLAPVTGQPCLGALCMALEVPEMKEFYAAAPQVGRDLRPLAEMIGAPVPEWLKLPMRVRDRGVRRQRAANGGLKPTLQEAGEMVVPRRRLPAKEQAEDAVRRAEASGKPIDLAKFSAEALGWFLHPPRDDNCPPPKIGYAGRRRRPPKDYRPPWE